MVNLFLSGLYLFIFIFAWYIVIMFGLKILKAIILKSGKANLGKWANPTIGLAISYIIMAIIIGF